MKRVKILYDVFKAMKNKEVINGILAVQVHKDEVSLFSFRNEFEKNLLTKHTKAKIHTELDYEGKQVKHESNTEFTLTGSGCCRHHEFFKRFHHGHGGCCAGLKGKLSKLTFALGLLMSLRTEEQDDGTTLLSLSSTDLPEDTKAMLREKASHMEECCQHHGFMKEFCTASNLDFVIGLHVNKNSEAQKVVATLAGTGHDPVDAPHDLRARAELTFLK